MNDTDLIAQLAGVPDLTANVSDILDQLEVGFATGSGAIGPLRSGATICGPAATLRYRLLDGPPADHRQAGIGDKPFYLAVRPGEIAVVECPHAETAVLGAVSAQWAALSGLAGMVIDGAVRDTASIIGAGLPVWAASRTPRAALGHFTVDAIGEPVTLAGNTVAAGDIVAADDDGIAVIPRAYLAEVTARCLEAQDREHTTLALIARCASVTELSAAMSGGSTHP